MLSKRVFHVQDSVARRGEPRIERGPSRVRIGGKHGADWLYARLSGCPCEGGKISPVPGEEVGIETIDAKNECPAQLLTWRRLQLS